MLKRVQHDKKKYVIPNLFRNLDFRNDNKLIAFVLIRLEIFTVLFPSLLCDVSRSGKVISGGFNVIREVPVYVFCSETMFQDSIFVEANFNLSLLNKNLASYSANPTLYCLIVS